MKYLQRLFCVLLVVATLFVTFSITVSAETSNNYDVDLNIYYCDDDNELDRQVTFPTDENVFTVTSADFNSEESFFDFEYIVTPKNDEILFKRNKTINLTISNLHLLLNYNNKYVYIKQFNNLKLLLAFTDGTYQYFDNVEYSYSTGGGTLSSNFETEKDVKNLKIISDYYITDGVGTSKLTLEYAENDTYIPNIDIEVSSEESGLLKGLINWVKGIFDSIGEGFKNMAEGFTNIINKLTEGFKNIVDSLLELPQKLWDLISEGLKNLFVPSEEYMTNYSGNWDELLSQRFGAIYDVSNIIINFVTNVTDSDTGVQETITLPEVSLENLGIPFTFGGYEVNVIPSYRYFGSIQATLKMLVSIVCTFMFINGLRRRYDEVMGVEQ